MPKAAKVVKTTTTVRASKAFKTRNTPKTPTKPEASIIQPRLVLIVHNGAERMELVSWRAGIEQYLQKLHDPKCNFRSLSDRALLRVLHSFSPSMKSWKENLNAREADLNTEREKLEASKRDYEARLESMKRRETKDERRERALKAREEWLARQLAMERRRARETGSPSLSALLAQDAKQQEATPVSGTEEEDDATICNESRDEDLMDETFEAARTLVLMQTGAR